MNTCDTYFNNKLNSFALIQLIRSYIEIKYTGVVPTRSGRAAKPPRFGGNAIGALCATSRVILLVLI